MYVVITRTVVHRNSIETSAYSVVCYWQNRSGYFHQLINIDVEQTGRYVCTVCVLYMVQLKTYHDENCNVKNKCVRIKFSTFINA